MRFWKYHGLGNDYLVIHATKKELTPAEVRLICDRHYGVGADGIMWISPHSGTATYATIIYNPDGSIAERSGNGLRIFACHLWQNKLVKQRDFYLETQSGAIHASAINEHEFSIQMGRASFYSQDIPMSGAPHEVVAEELLIADQKLSITAVNVGNPHCVVACSTLDESFTQCIGSLIERNQRFPQRTNVQFMKVDSRHQISIQIWERGAGYTLASGSSSCAAAAAAMRQELCSSPVTVCMPGGQLKVAISTDYHITLTGAVQFVMHGELSENLLQSIQ